MSSIYPFLLSARIKAFIPYLLGLVGIYCLAPKRHRKPTMVSSTDKFLEGCMFLLKLEMRASNVSWSIVWWHMADMQHPEINLKRFLEKEMEC